MPFAPVGTLEALAQHLDAEYSRRTLLEEMAELGYWEIRLDSLEVAVSPGSAKLLGRPGTETVAFAEVIEQVREGDRPAVLEALTAATSAGTAECECTMLGVDGVSRRLLLRGRHEQDPSGREVVRGASVDITRRYQAERAQERTARLFFDGFDKSPTSMAVIDVVTGRYTRVNRALCRMLGYSQEQLLERTVYEVLAPEEREPAIEAMRKMRAGCVEGLEHDRRYVRADGETVWTIVHVAPVVDEDGETQAIFAQSVDITERREREQRLAADAADLQMLADLREAMHDDRLLLYSQPIVSLGSGEVLQRELLVRLQTPSGEILPASAFVPVAERHGCIEEIDSWVVARALERAAAGERVQVNLSAASIGSAPLLEQIRTGLAQSGANPALLVFEITETALMADLEEGRCFIGALRKLGCRVALDDFGTGYGTFTYLKHLPIDIVKIDREFITDLCSNPDDAKLVAAIVTMATNLGKHVVAEGVESAATVACLRAVGIKVAQGYHFGRPAPLPPLPPLPPLRPAADLPLLGQSPATHEPSLV